MGIENINDYNDFITFICSHRYWQDFNGNEAEILEIRASDEIVILKTENESEGVCTFTLLVDFYVPITISQYMSDKRMPYNEWKKVYNYFNLNNIYNKLKAMQMNKENTASSDRVNHPDYYKDPSGIECIDIVRYRNFNIGSAIKYLWRAGLKKEEGLNNKDKQIEDLKKAVWYIKDEIKRLKTE